MTNSLKKQTQGEVMNIPPGVDRREAADGTVTYRVRIRKMPLSGLGTEAG